MSIQTGFSTAGPVSAGAMVRNSTLLVLGDALAAVAAFAVSGFLGYWLSDLLEPGPPPLVDGDLVVRRIIHYAVFVAGLMLWLAVQGHYNRRIPFWTELKQIVLAVALAGLLDGFSQYAFKQQFSRVWLGTNWAMVALFLVMARHGVKAMLTALGTWQCPTLLVGSGPTARAAQDALASERHLGYVVVGSVALGGAAADDRSTTAAVWSAYRRFGARFVVVAPDAADIPRTEPVIADLTRRRVNFAVIPSIFGMSVLGLRSESFFSHDVVMLTGQNNLAEPLMRVMKRLFDVTVASALLVLLAPFMLGVAALIRRDGGPALFAHRRVGMNDTRFGCLKFRTMIVNADEVLRRVLETDPEARAEWERDFKLRNDPRITPVGRFLRRTSLDELPQLINVVRGEMSLVGPRPIIEKEMERYGDDIRYYLEARPGLTGLWQVSGRNDSGYGRRVKLDAWYVKNWSLWHDITILLKTVRVVLTKEGAY